ncbi:MAG TPA: hypothetical protein VF828_01165 [Patescibacteria group bacterium]
MSAEMVGKINYAVSLTRQARILKLPDFCGPVSLVPFCSRPQNIFDLDGLVRQHESGFFDLGKMIARSGLSVMAGLDFDPAKDADSFAELYANPKSVLVDDCPEVSGRPLKGLLMWLSTPDGEDGHAFSLIPNVFMPRDLRRVLNSNGACMVVDINLDTVVKPVLLTQVPEYTKVYMEDLGFSEATVLVLTDKRLHENLVEVYQ